MRAQAEAYRASAGQREASADSPAAAPSLARVVGGGLAAAVVVALRIPTNPGTRVVR